jgi:hypothetical protein
MRIRTTTGPSASPLAGLGNSNNDQPRRMGRDALSVRAARTRRTVAAEAGCVGPGDHLAPVRG